MFRKLVILTFGLSFGVWALCANYPTRSNTLQHFMTTSVASQGLFDAFNISFGAVGQVGMSYEMGYEGFFANVGLNLDYTFKGYVIDSLRDVYSLVDKDDQKCDYHYVYNHFRERQHALFLSLPVQVGYEFEFCYLAAGIKVGIPIVGKYHTTTKLYTVGRYGESHQLFEDLPKYGYYPSTQYGYKSTFSPALISITPHFEMGRAINISNKVHCRLGAFIEYAILLQKSAVKQDLLDYSHVNQDPHFLSQADLYANIRFNSVINSLNNVTLQKDSGKELIGSMVQNIQAGIRCTFVFQVMRKKSFCHCK